MLNRVLATLLLSTALVGPGLAQTTVTLQQGLNSYTGASDTRIWAANPTTNYGANGLTVSHEAQNSSSLIRFAIFQSEGGPVPNDAVIISATLSAYKYYGSNAVIKASRVLKNWNQSQATWNIAATGTNWTTAGAQSSASDYLATPDGQGSVADASANDCGVWPTTWPAVCWLSIDVTSGVQAFANGTPNYGWKLAYVSGANAFSNKDFNPSEHNNLAGRPKLVITYTTGAPSGCNSGTLRPYEGSPINGTPIAIGAAGATTFEAEHFNCGGEGVAYHDNVAGNAGGQFRTAEDVDMIASTDSAGGGYVVNNFYTGEWLTYTINVAQAGTYELAIRAANDSSPTGAFHIEIDGVDVTGSVLVPVTGSLSTFQWVTKSGVTLAAGQHVLKLVSDQQYFHVNQIRLTSTAPQACNSGASRPYDAAPVNGTPIQIAGSGATTFEAEHFNCGGQDVAYHDNVAGNAGGQLRTTEDVDIIVSTDSAGGGYVVNNFYTGEWLTYTINVAQAGTYDLAIRAANDSSPTGAFHVEIDGTNVTGSVVVPVTGSLSTFQWVTKTGVALSAGQHVLKLASDQQYFHINQIRLTAAVPTQGCNAGALRPYDGAPVNGSPIPIAASGATTFEAEHFNCGGQGVAYHDNVAGNAGGQLRTTEDVDIIVSNDPAGGGYVVSDFETGEWLSFSINVAQNGNYDLAIRAANDGTPAAFRIEVDGSDATGSVAVPGTGGLGNFQWFTKAGVALAAGTRVLKLLVDQQHFNVNQLRLTPASAPGGTEYPSTYPLATNGDTRPTFHSMSLYANDLPPSGNEVFVRYRKATDDPATASVWKQGYPLRYDARSTNPGCTSACGLPYQNEENLTQRVRGSVVLLDAGTKYVFELGHGPDASNVSWQWHLVGTTWTQSAQASWPETLAQDGATVPVGSGSEPYVITAGGSPATGYTVYDGCQSYSGSSCVAKNVINRNGADTTVAGREADDRSHAIVIKASYVVLRNIRATGAAISGIYIAPNVTNVVIEDSQIDGWAHRPGVDTDAIVNPNPNSWSSPEKWGWNHAAGVYLAGNNSRVLVQRTQIKEPRNGSFPWDTLVDGANVQCNRETDTSPDNHPHGPVGIHISHGGRQNVIRYNEITGHPTDKKKWYLDGIGGRDNFSGQGSPGADSDIYQNIVMHVFDDAIEAEGGGRNVRVWGNYISDTKTAVATSIVHFGPLYIWRNVVNRVRLCHQQVNQDGDWFNEAFKLAGRKGTSDMWGDGIRYYFHNTLLQDPGGGGLPEGAGKALTAESDGNRSARFTVARNNIFHVRSDCLTTPCAFRWAWSVDGKGSPLPEGWDFAANLFNGRYAPTAERDANIALGFGFSGSEVGYSAGHGPGSVPQLGGGGEGNYQLASGKKGRDTWLGNGANRQCELLANFSDGFLGSAPDCGAHEAGTPAMKFGITAGQQ